MKKRNKIVTETKSVTTPTASTDQTTVSVGDTPDKADVSETTPEPPATDKSDHTTDSKDEISSDKTVDKSAVTTSAKVSESKAAAKKTSAKDTPTSANIAQSKTDTNKAKQADKTKDNAKPAATTNTKAANDEPKRTNKTGKLALVISLIALGFTGFQYYQGLQAQSATQDIDQNIASLKQQLTAGISSAATTANSIKEAADASLAKADSAIKTVNANLLTLQQAETNKSKDIDALQARLTQSIQQVEASGLAQNSRKDWLLAEVEYLLRLANQRVLMENTPIGALALLNSADEILQQTDDVSIFSVRKALAADIAALAAVPPIDQEGLYLKIDALSAQINQLKLVPITDKKQLPKIIDQVTTEAVSDAQQSSFSKIWDKASAKLEKLVVISNRDSAIEPLLSPAQQAGLLQNLHILFEQTQLALLQRKQLPYQRSIEKAEVIINSHFQAKDGTSMALLAGLQGLKEQQISVALPSIAGSLNSLKSYLKQGAEIKSGVLKP